MNRLPTLRSILVLAAATYLMLAGHENFAQVLARMLADRGVPGASRHASPAAAILVHAITGIFVLPLLHYLRRLFQDPDVPRIAVMTTIAAIGARALFEAASGVVVQGLPLLTMAVGAAALPVLVAPRAVAVPRRLRLVRHTARGRRDADAAA